MSKHKFVLQMVKDLFARYLSNHTCNRNGYLSIWWISKGKRFVVFKHRSHVEYTNKVKNTYSHGSETCPVHYDLYDVSKSKDYDIILTEDNTELNLTGRWCKAHEDAVNKKIAEIIDAEK